MYAMHVLFDLKPGVALETVEDAMAAFSSHLRRLGLVEGTTPIARRDRHPVLDTARDHGHEFFSTMSFRDRAQADRAVEEIKSRSPETLRLHRAVFGRVASPLFLCFDDRHAVS